MVDTHSITFGATPSITMASPNVTAVSSGATGVYDITISGVTYSKTTFVTIATLIDGDGEIWAGDDGTNKLRISTGTSNGTLTNGRNFYFVVFKP